MINAIQIALSGLNAASKTIEASASNIANAGADGALDPAKGPAPYQALTTAQTTLTDGNGGSAGVQTQIIPSQKPFVPAFSPDSPFANADGLVATPNVNLAEDIVNLQVASNSYKANLKVIQAQSDIQKDLLSIFDKKA